MRPRPPYSTGQWMPAKPASWSCRLPGLGARRPARAARWRRSWAAPSARCSASHVVARSANAPGRHRCRARRGTVPVATLPAHGRAARRDRPGPHEPARRAPGCWRSWGSCTSSRPKPFDRIIPDLGAGRPPYLDLRVRRLGAVVGGAPRQPPHQAVGATPPQPRSSPCIRPTSRCDRQPAHNAARCRHAAAPAAADPDGGLGARPRSADRPSASAS